MAFAAAALSVDALKLGGLFMLCLKDSGWWRWVLKFDLVVFDIMCLGLSARCKILGSFNRLESLPEVLFVDGFLAVLEMWALIEDLLAASRDDLL